MKYLLDFPIKRLALNIRTKQRSKQALGNWHCYPNYVNASRCAVGSASSGPSSLRGEKYWSTKSCDTCFKLGGSHCIFSRDLLAGDKNASMVADTN